MTPKAGTRIVPLSSIGICEHCERLLSLIDLPGDAMNAKWRCPYCKGILNGKSFGYVNNVKQTHWVGPDGKWSTTKPTKSFFLDNWEIVPRIPQPPFFSR